MREIKFRAWDADFGKMAYEFTEDTYSTDMQNGRLAVGGVDGNGDYFELPIMQYTGLKDKNGKEIYEGDIIKSINITMYGGKYMVQWEQKFCAYVCVLPNVKPILLMDFLNAEILGNIYENPELLTNDKARVNS